VARLLASFVFLYTSVVIVDWLTLIANTFVIDKMF